MTNFTPGTNINPMAGFTPLAEFQGLAQYTQGAVGMLNGQIQQLKRRMFPVDAEWRLQREGRKPRMPVAFRSQFGEDLAIYELLDGQLDGLYIECGAFDGTSFAATYAFDAMGWDGLLVEAIPERFEQCKKARPAAKVEHAALSKPGHLPTMGFTVTADRFGGMLSFATTDQSHLKAIGEMPRRTVEVPVFTMNTLLERHFTGRRVDAAVIDVEGGELDVLAGFDLKKWMPRVLLLEDNQAGQDPRLENYMKSQPYIQLGWIEVNRIYVHTGETEILARVGVQA